MTGYWRGLLIGALLLLGGQALAGDGHGPYDARFLAGGIGLERALGDARLPGNKPWSLDGWVELGATGDGVALIGGVGAPVGDGARYLALENGRPALWLDGAVVVSDRRKLGPGWHHLAASHDGKFTRLWLDGKEIGAVRQPSKPAIAALHLAPTGVGDSHFGGAVARFMYQDRALDRQALAQAAPDFDLLHFIEVGVGWLWQAKQLAGLAQPQDAWTLPTSNSGFSKPQRSTRPPTPALRATADGRWTIGGWRMIEAPRLHSDLTQLHRADYDDRDWYPATVPGTALTTLIDQGVYPDPYYGLNNMAIPERLARQDYWYRARFDLPAAAAGKQLRLTFNGINYQARVWLNGKELGGVKGAFIRGRLEASGVVRPKANILVVRISPPPHPGIPHEESIKAGPGENGGAQAIDGPTFIASEGWDWIPGIRDRNSGLWQDVELIASGALRLGDPQIVTRLPDIDHALISIEVPVENLGSTPIDAIIHARSDDFEIEKPATIPPGGATIAFSPAEFQALNLKSPRLWWPNGYGEPALHDLALSIESGGERQDHKNIRFGIREISYELSLFDAVGRLRRAELRPALSDAKLMDVRHQALKQSPKGWAASFQPGAESSPAVTLLDDERLTPHLVLKVNGVRIASRGGNWGTDDALKRVSRDRLEPYFRLHKEAGLNTIRNWVGQNTEDVFYDLADEYGLLILNDFWASTQDFQVEPQDPALFLANARDVIEHYRNHPSIALWFGRNEGVPQPILNEGLDDLVAELDGTRLFMGSSNRVNLQGSGPYNYREPVEYFTEHAEGYSVEVGTPSLSTREAIEASIPAADRWPISDTLAYHDWHFGGNGDVKSFMAALETQFGKADSLADFERKAQMMNYVTHRAMFEGFNAGLWTRNSGRLLWMSHSAWPSNMWQIYSADYDTHAAYYGVKKAAEPLHVQLNLPDHGLNIVNTTLTPRTHLRLEVEVRSLDNQLLSEASADLDAAANATTDAGRLELAAMLAKHGAVLVRLRLRSEAGGLLSENLYWPAHDPAALQRLNTLADAAITATARASGKDLVEVLVRNDGKTPALNLKLTLLRGDGERNLPAYYSDNYLSLLPGETRTITIAASSVAGGKLGLRGWNLVERTFGIEP